MTDKPDQDSKTEEPTEKKLQDAETKGNTPFSRETPVFASLGALLVLCAFYIPAVGKDVAVLLWTPIADFGNWPLETGGDAVNLLFLVFSSVLIKLAPIFAALGAAGLIAALIQNPPRVVFERIKPQMSRVSLASGMKRMFGAHGAQEFVKSLAKLGIAIAVGMMVFATELDTVLQSMVIDASQIPLATLELVVKVVLGVTIAMLALAILDLLWSRRNWLHELKMTRQEVKDEHKQSEGDPIIKGRVRSLARDRSRRRMINDVASATLVVTNPTHYAIAMRYREGEDRAPVVVAKGQDLIALKIREKAEEEGVTLYEDPPLARAMYSVVEVDTEIPAEFYLPVAQIIRRIRQADRRMRA